MKKLLAILSSTTLAVSGGATVVACSQSATSRPDLSKFNNSLANLQGASSSWAKELILADQFNLSVPTLNNALGNLSAKDVVEIQAGLEYDNHDFNLSEDSDLKALTDQYFKNQKTSGIKLTGDINLNGQIGTKDDQLWKILEDKMGVSLDKDTQSIIDGVIGDILPTLTTSGLEQLLGKMLPTLDEILNNLGQDKKTIFEAISIACKALFTNPEYVAKLNAMVDSFDIGTTYSNLHVKNITSAAMISLSNAIGLFIDADYKVTAFSKPADVEMDILVSNKVKEAGTSLGKLIGELIFPTPSEKQSAQFGGRLINEVMDTFANDLETNIDRYVTAIANLFQFLQFLQLQFSLFDETKGYQPTDANHLFNAEQTNKEYLQTVLSEEKTIRSITNTPDGKNVEGTLNLKYLLAVIKDAFSSLKNPDDENGYSLQKFLAILLLDAKEVKIDDYVDYSMASAFAGWSTNILNQILVQYLTVGLGLEGVGPITILTSSTIRRFLTTAIDQLLTGQSLEKPIIYLVEDLLKLIQTALSVAGGAIPADVKEILEQILLFQDVIKGLVPKIIAAVPLLNAPVAFKELYSGDPLAIEPLITVIKDFKKDVTGLIPESVLGIFDTLINGLESFLITKDNFLPDGLDLNLKNLLLTPLEKINNQSLVPPQFGGHYLKLSVYEIVNEVCDAVYVSGEETLAGFGEDSPFNFKLSYLKKLINMIIKYDYSGLPKQYQGMNLISIILENAIADENSHVAIGEILGFVGFDEKNKDKPLWGKGSLLDLIFNEILKANNQNDDDENALENDPLYFIATLISSIYKNLNQPGVDYTQNYQTLFTREDDFNFVYQNPNWDDDGAILGQILKVEYHNQENNTDWIYTFNYSREKVSDSFKFQAMKKEANPKS